MRAHDPPNRDAQARPARPGTGSAALTGSVAAMLALQRRAGNAAVTRAIQRRCDGHAPDQAQSHEHGPDQGQSDKHGHEQRSAVHEVLRSTGRPLDEPVRQDMEARLGADFSDVRLHTGALAQRSAAEVGARAYTSGSHVVIGQGGTDRHTLAHELTHVIQQRTGPVAGTDNGHGLQISDPADTYERAAETNAARALAGHLPDVPFMPDTHAAVHQLHVQRSPNDQVGDQTEKEEKTVLVAIGSTGKKMKVTCERGKKPGTLWVVFLPSGIAPDQRKVIAEELKTPEEDIKFTNARDDVITLEDGTQRQGSEKAKVGRSKQLVLNYLHSVGITVLDGAKVEDALEKSKVTFFESNSWEVFLLKQDVRHSAEATEGITTPGPRGSREVGLNKAIYTLPTIVHELFHVLEHESLRDYIPGMCEGITEYWTSRATGVDFRCDRSGEGRVYGDNIRFIRNALANGIVTESDLQKGYFHGEKGILSQLDNAYHEHEREIEETSFAYTGGRRK
jgi:hypothetical protein